MNLKEEIERIKSLFTEERMFGNLVREVENPDKNIDKKIDSSELEDVGGYISIKQAKEFIRKSGKLTVLDVEDCDTTVDNTPHLKCVKEALVDSKFKDMYQLFHQSMTIGCAFQITRFNGILEGIEAFTDAITGDYSVSNTKLTLTIWEKGKYKGNKKTFALLLEFDTPLAKIDGIGDIVTEKVSWVRLRGVLNDSCDINNIWVDQIYSNRGEHSGLNNLTKMNRINDIGEVNTITKLLSKIKTS